MLHNFRSCSAAFEDAGVEPRTDFDEKRTAMHSANEIFKQDACSEKIDVF